MLESFSSWKSKSFLIICCASCINSIERFFLLGWQFVRHKFWNKFFITMNCCNWSASLLHMKVTFNSRIWISSTCNFVHNQGSRQSCHSTWRHRRSKKMESVDSNTNRRSKDSNKNGGYTILLTSKYNNHEHMFNIAATNLLKCQCMCS